MGLAGGLKQFLKGKSSIIHPLASPPAILRAKEAVDYRPYDGAGHDADVGVCIPSSRDATPPLALFVDIMTALKKLRGSEEPVDGDRSYRADDLADSLLSHYERFAAAHASRFSGKVTVCLAFDKAGSIPPEKLELQAHRVATSKTKPYAADPAVQKIQIVDAGLSVDGAAPVPLDMDRLCLTRPLRPFFYRYLAERARTRLWRLPLRFILDAEFASASGLPGDALEDQVWTFDVACANCVAQLEQTGPLFRVGEGEITAVLWALRFRRTHHCQVWSGDSDLLPMLLLHGHEFSFSLTSVLSNCYVFVYAEAMRQLKQAELTPETFLAAVAAIGTDYTRKKNGFHRVPTECIWAAARRWGRTKVRRQEEQSPASLPKSVRSVRSALSPPPHRLAPAEEVKEGTAKASIGTPWNSPETFWLFMRDVYTVHALRREQKRKEIYREDLDATRKSHRELWATKAKVKLPEPEVARAAFRAFSFVACYWVGLHDHAERSDGDGEDDDTLATRGMRRFLHVRLNGRVS
jgi:hypothetical protein